MANSGHLAAGTMRRDVDLRRTWLLGPGTGDATHAAMRACGADVLIVDLEDFTPSERRPEARLGLGDLLESWRALGTVTAVRINALDGDGIDDLASAMPARPDIIAYPMASSGEEMRALDDAISRHERLLGLGGGTTEILPV